MSFPATTYKLIVSQGKELVESLRLHFRLWREPSNEEEDPELRWYHEVTACRAVADGFCGIVRYLRRITQPDSNVHPQQQLRQLLAWLDLLTDVHGWGAVPDSPHASWPFNLEDPRFVAILPELLDSLQVALEEFERAVLAESSAREPRPPRAQEQPIPDQPHELPNSAPALANVEAAQSRLIFDIDTLTITLDGTPIGPLPPVGFHIVKALSEAGGVQLSAAQLQMSVPGCKGDEKTLRRHIENDLPLRLRACIKGKPGCGRWLVLPPRK